jgi:hypothetical protein
MESRAASRVSSEWKTLYQAALLEVDLKILPQRIADAERAANERIQDFNGSDDAEKVSVMNALNVLRDLRKMASTEDQSNV